MATFGDTTAGGETFPTSTDRGVVSKFTLTEAGTVTEINIRFTGSGAINFKGVIYDDDGSAGSPGTLLIVGAATAAASGVVASSASGELAAGDYWVGCVTNDPGFDLVCDASGASDVRYNNSCTYTSPPAWSGTDSNPVQLNAYVTYTPAASGKPWNYYAQQ
jgi:hypothetical protein